MNIDLVMRKATALLDGGDKIGCERYLTDRLGQAEAAREQNTVARLLCALGELLHAQRREPEAKVYLDRLVKMQFVDDVMVPEIRRARQILTELNNKA